MEYYSKIVSVLSLRIANIALEVSILLLVIIEGIYALSERLQSVQHSSVRDKWCSL